MPVKPPTPQELMNLADGFGMNLTKDDVLSYLELMQPNFESYNLLDQMPDFVPEVRYPRTPGYSPEGEENRLNAWYRKTSIRGEVEGPLTGKTVVLKDNICLAGVPMMNGTSTLEGYTPEVDATVVTRILEAGGEIVGKAHCEHFCLSGGSHTNSKGAVRNPHKLDRSSGGSSSGCGALVGAGEVDMAIGCDQGGSIRIPSSWCGAYGMKPTHGLVPYSGIMPIETTIDYAGPITTSVVDNALLLQVIAGSDGLDPRQYNPPVNNYSASLEDGVEGLSVGVVEEGFGLTSSEEDVDHSVEVAAAHLSSLGANVERVSIPMHLQGVSIWTPIALEGLTNQMMHGNAFGTGWEGLYVTSLINAHASWRERADELSDALKISMFVGEYMQKKYRGYYYAKAQNISRNLRATYDKALGQFDLLLMPTLPMTATPTPDSGCDRSEYIQRAFEMIANTAPFDVTGHPAMTVPCGMSEGLPIGMMLVGKHYREAVIYQLAHAFEQSTNWRNMDQTVSLGLDSALA